ncbi:unnamed protein product [Vitrella brassicaformis CCMP3155]|uniref:Uncharacterized protein n=1 Tax=Vitrella brassicaformis (strain CCMP3155) TaxID=1169540 RepID=A0A0G4ED91_VITBC|nr:unnamed protein product [Vitrella brassicaformis CCMP3155]|eukprot:CEL93652.1 unnamed protein product [Vitrella brassicaformis CCMP3155]
MDEKGTAERPIEDYDLDEEGEGEGDEDQQDEGGDVQDDDDAETLTVQGEEAKRAKEYVRAIHRFCKALELKLAEYDNEDGHPDLAAFYLNYGDALLTNEENSEDFLKQLSQLDDQQGASTAAAAAAPATSAPSASKKDQPSSSSAAAASASASAAESSSAAAAAGGGGGGGADEEEFPIVETDHEDLQLAWEILEVARRAYEKRINAQERAGNVAIEDVRDLTFVIVRLGDILMLKGEFSQAAEEFARAIELRKQHNLPPNDLHAPLIALAQAHTYADENQKALEAYQLAYEGMEKAIQGVGGTSLSPERKEDYQVTMEEVQENMAALRRKIEGGEANLDKGTIRDIRSEARQMGSMQSSASSAFGQPQLSGGQVRDIGVVSAKRTGDGGADEQGDSKKRRIDLSAAAAKTQPADQDGTDDTAANGEDTK